MAKAGRPGFVPTAELRTKVEAWAAVGVNHIDICMLLQGSVAKPIDPKTLRKHFRYELDTGAIRANAAVAGNVFRKATSDRRDSMAAAKLWLTTRAGWKATDALEVSGPNGAPIQTETTALTTEEKAARFALILAAAKQRKADSEST